MYLVRTPDVIKPLAKDFVWNIPSSGKEIFLTFDDGPTPGITEEILDLLATHRALATFFCVGKNIENNPRIFQRILQDGHHVGHHTFHHSDGWKTPLFGYMRDALLASELVGTNLFRPPYGRITRSQAAALKTRFRLIMWEILSGDFDPSLSADQCARNVLRHARSGSIVVLHDSVKAGPRSIPALKQILAELSGQGFSFSPIPYA